VNLISFDYNVDLTSIKEMQAEDDFCKKKKNDLAGYKKQNLKDFELMNGILRNKKLGR